MISSELRSFRLPPLLWVVIVLVLGLLAYVGLHGFLGHESLLDEKEQREIPVKSENVVKKKEASPSVSKQKTDGNYLPGELDPLFAVLASPGAEQAAGIRLAGYGGVYADQLVSYVKRMSLMRKSPGFYLGEGSALLVIEQSPLGFEEIADLAGHLGKITNKDERIRFIEIEVNKSLLEAPPQPVVLLNPSNPRYVEANIQELSKLDNSRIASAARRLASVEAPSEELRQSVCASLIHLLNDPWGNDVDYVRSLTLGLAAWASPQDDVAFQAVANAVTALGNAKIDVPESCLVFVAKGDPNKAAAVLEPLWKADPVKLEEIMVRLTSVAEKRSISALALADASLEWRCSAVRVLGEIGGRNALPVLNALKEDKDESVRLFAEGALRSIEKRMNDHQD